MSNTGRRDENRRWRSQRESYRTQMHPHHWWLLSWCMKVMDREGLLDELDPDIVDDLKFTLMVTNPNDRS